jgi:hypothetical protein
MFILSFIDPDMTLEIHVMAWDRCKNVARAGLINGIQSLSLLIIGSPITIDINKQ